jgi:hypothetical protein
MRRSIKVAFVIVASSLIAVSIAGYRACYLDHGPASDEFATYSSFLARLAADGIDNVALGDTTSKLGAFKGESWTPTELQPDPPEKAAPPLVFVEFCGNICGRDFMKKNLRAWQLKPSSDIRFPFVIVSGHSESSSDRKRIVSVTRTGFNFWRDRAVFSYSFDCTSSTSAGQVAALCIQMGEVLLEKTNGTWRVASYSGSIF